MRDYTDYSLLNQSINQSISTKYEHVRSEVVAFVESQFGLRHDRTKSIAKRQLKQKKNVEHTAVAKVTARSQLRSARRHLVVIPRYTRSTYGRRAFSVAGPMTWNSFTDSLRHPSSSSDSFRRQLKTFLFSN